MNELWQSISGYESLYEISNEGKIKSLITNTILKNQLNRNGYLYVDLVKNHKRKRHYIHRLVALTFLPNLENKREVNHINGIKTDNRLFNLEWTTTSENHKHAWRIGLYSEDAKKRIKEAAKITILKRCSKKVNQIANGIIINTYPSVMEATRQTNIKNIGKVVRHERYSAGGYQWEFAN